MGIACPWESISRQTWWPFRSGARSMDFNLRHVGCDGKSVMTCQTCSGAAVRTSDREALCVREMNMPPTATVAIAAIKPTTNGRRIRMSFMVELLSCADALIGVEAAEQPTHKE